MTGEINANHHCPGRASNLDHLARQYKCATHLSLYTVQCLFFKSSVWKFIKSTKIPVFNQSRDMKPLELIASFINPSLRKMSLDLLPVYRSTRFTDQLTICVIKKKMTLIFHTDFILHVINNIIITHLNQNLAFLMLVCVYVNCIIISVIYILSCVCWMLLIYSILFYCGYP